MVTTMPGTLTAFIQPNPSSVATEIAAKVPITTAQANSARPMNRTVGRHCQLVHPDPMIAIGYAAMSRFITNAGAFYSYVSQGVGRPAGVGASVLASF